MEFIYLFLLGVAGILLHILMKFRDALSKTPKNGMTVKERFVKVLNGFDILGNLFYAIFAMIIVAVVVLIRDALPNILPVTELTIIFIGYTADSAIKNLKPENINI